jgi:hypothetical protein
MISSNRVSWIGNVAPTGDIIRLNASLLLAAAFVLSHLVFLIYQSTQQFYNTKINISIA